MLTRAVALLVLPMAAWCGDWDAAAAARYLDGRAAKWAAWDRAAREGGPCISCHTTLGYLLARSALRRTLGEADATKFENGLVAGVRVRTAKAAGGPAGDNTQRVLAALVLAMDDARRGAGLSDATEAAFRNLWATQRADGAWGWTDANLEPWEVPESVYFGAALAAVATGIAPAGYQSRPEIAGNVARMRDYLREYGAHQPLANRLVLLWAASRLNGLASDKERFAILDEVLAAQSADGGWTLAALGPWRDRPKAPPAPGGSKAYATAWAAAMLRLSSIDSGDEHLSRALAWLRTHQNGDGSWDAVSMNKTYEPGSMQERFMRDATTAYAVVALSR